MHRAPPDLLERALLAQRRRAERRRIGVVAVLLLGAGWAAGTAVPLDHLIGAERGAVGAAQTPSELVEVLDLHAPGASSVAVAGSWNEWQATPMTEQGGTFFTVLKLHPGRYEYMFVIDGKRWVPDPDAPLSRDDGFGQRNSILEL